MTTNNNLPKHRIREHNNLIVVEELNFTQQSRKPYYKCIADWDIEAGTGNINLDILSPDKNYKTFGRWKNAVKKDIGVIITQTLK